VDLQSGSAGPGWPAPSAGPQGLEALLPPPPPRPPGDRRWLRWVAAAGVLAVTLGILVVPRVIRAVSGPARGANAYLRLVRDGADDAAYASLCSELRQQTSAADFVAALRAEADQAGHLETFNVYRSTAEIGGNTGLVEFRAHTTKGDLAMEARMVHEGGQWRWCGSRPQPKSTGITIHFP